MQSSPFGCLHYSVVTDGSNVSEPVHLATVVKSFSCVILTLAIKPILLSRFFCFKCFLHIWIMILRNICRLESQCVTAISFVKNEPELLDSPIWILIINIVALEMLKAKLPQGEDISIYYLYKHEWWMIELDNLEHVVLSPPSNEQIIHCWTPFLRAKRGVWSNLKSFYFELFLYVHLTTTLQMPTKTKQTVEKAIIMQPKWFFKN